MAFIIVEKGDNQDTGKCFILEKNTTVIGRFAVDNNPDIEIHDEYISRSHVEITSRENSFMLRDLGSKNGSELDGQRVIPNQLYPLTNDAVIGLAIAQAGARVLLRYRNSPTTSTIQVQEIGDFAAINWLQIDKDKREVRVDGKPVMLAKKEFWLLLFLLHKSGKICTRDEIISKVWPEVTNPGAVSNATVDQLVYRLRQKVETDPSKPSRILSKKGFGFYII